MNNSKLVNLLRTFSKHEMKEFEKVVASPYFNKGRNYLPFLNQLKKFAPAFESEKMTDEYIFSKMYPGKKYNKQLIWNTTSALYNMAEEYLSYSSLKKNKFLHAKQIAWEMHNRKLPQVFSRKIDEMKADLDKSKIHPGYFLSKIDLEIASREYYYLEEKQRFITGHIIKGGEYSILYFLWTILGVINDLLVHSYLYNAQFKINVPLEFLRNLQMEKVIEYCRAGRFSYTWLMEMYYNQIMMYLEPDDAEYFSRLKELFEHNYDRFHDTEKLNWITCLMNYCVGSKKDLRRTLFEIHKFELKEGIAVFGKYMLVTHYLQILRNSLSINEIEWVQNFIEEYVPKLHPSYQKPIRALSTAYLYSKLKEHNKVLDILKKVFFKDVKDKILLKLLYLRTYFDLNETEAVLSQLDSTTHFMKNNISHFREDLAANHRRFLIVLKKLVTIKEKEQHDNIGDIEKYVIKNKTIVHREWLLEKISEIKN